MNIVELSTDEAQVRFLALPRRLQVQTLSPEFAAADAMRQGGLRCVHAWIQAGEHQWLKSVHLRALPQGAGRAALSPYGYGDVLCATRLPDFLREAWGAWTQWCAVQGILAEFCRFHPHVSDLQSFGGVVRQNRETVSVDLTAADYESQFSSLVKRKLRKSRGVEIVWSQEFIDWKRFAGFYRDAMRSMDASEFYFFPDTYFDALAVISSAWVVICHQGGQWLSAGVYFLGPDVAEYHLGANSARGYELGTPYLMQAEAMQRARARGAHSLYLGGGTDSSPDNSLLFHKRSFGRRMLPFFVGEAIHDEPRYWALASSLGFSAEHPPSRILFD